MDSHKSKYLKYKQKYVTLKNLVGGGKCSGYCTDSRNKDKAHTRIKGADGTWECAYCRCKHLN